jgi:hypothetical protein
VKKSAAGFGVASAALPATGLSLLSVFSVLSASFLPQAARRSAMAIQVLRMGFEL